MDVRGCAHHEQDLTRGLVAGERAHTTAQEETLSSSSYISVQCGHVEGLLNTPHRRAPEQDFQMFATW